MEYRQKQSKAIVAQNTKVTRKSATGIKVSVDEQKDREGNTQGTGVNL